MTTIPLSVSQRLTISISQIAPLVGLDSYNNFPRIVCEIWRKYNPTDFKIIETKLKESGNTQLATSSELNDIWEADEALGTNILQKVKEINSNKDKTSNDMVKNQNIIKDYIQSQTKLDNTQKQELAKKVCSVTNKMHGVNNEDAIIDQFCKLSEKQIKSTQGWLEIPIDITENAKLPLTWLIVGKYDGITTDNELVEAKMRQKGLFKKLRDYENIQVQLYLHALQFEQAYLVESYTNKKGEMQIYVNETKYDKDYVEDMILRRIQQFICFFEFAMSNDEIKENLLKGDINRKIYNKYEIEYLGIDTLDF
jgi:hypothetical protein